MHGQNYIDYLAYVCAVAAAVTVGRDSLKKRTIENLTRLVATLQTRIDVLEGELEDKNERICVLEETVDGYSELVREGHLVGSGGQGSRNRTATSKNPKNRTP